MSAVTFEVSAEMRKDLGKGASRRLRHSNKVPGVVYGGGEPAVSLTLDHNQLFHALSHEAFYSRILTLTVDGKAEKVVLKALQRHPAKPRVCHVDFQRVRANQKLHMHVPLHFIGEESAPGIAEGGVFSHAISDVEVSCFPADLPEFITVDVSQFVLDQVIHLSELVLPKGVELVAFAHGVEGHDMPVVSLHVPHVVEESTEELAAAEGDAAAPAEGEAGADAADAKKE